MTFTKPLSVLTVAIVAASMGVAHAQDDMKQRVLRLDERQADLEQHLKSLDQRLKSESGGVLILFGVFCALWAQNTNRNPWLWFFLGLFFNVITVLVLLAKNAGDRRRLHNEQQAL